MDVISYFVLTGLRDIFDNCFSFYLYIYIFIPNCSKVTKAELGLKCLFTWTWDHKENIKLTSHLMK